MANRRNPPQRNRRPQYHLPVELLETFNTQWAAYKSVKEYMEFAATNTDMREQVGADTYAQLEFMIGRLLGEDMTVTFTEIIHRTGTAYAALPNQ
jgi:hypothetical protein